MLDARELLRGLLRQLECVSSLSDFQSQYARDELIDALLRAGELECAFEDRGFTSKAGNLAKYSDELARALIGQRRPGFPEITLQDLSAIEISDRLTLSNPEGFCYYALHPLDYIDMLMQVDIRPPAAAVIGIRSIGTTLSAVVRAWFEHRGIPSERITVRPTGHPFDRKLLLDCRQREWVGANAQRAAMFFIVDEGPGLSGSSFLSVAEALVSAGISTERIVLLPSSKPDLSALIAENAAARWSKFRTVSLNPTRYIPSGAALGIQGGEWRKRILASESEWPAVWSWTERQKYLSADCQRIFRFDGHGHYGKAVLRRSEILAEHGWGPEISSAGNGFSVSPWIQGTRGHTLDRQLFIQLAQYCAFRAEHFRCEQDSLGALEEMARINLERAVGVSRAIVLPLEHPVIADGRMMPHEWIRSSTGRMLKVDASSHGDDHFYPGPTDIAWDLAGTIAEWKLEEEASEVLVSEYKRFSGDDVTSRLPAYLLAYCGSRLGFTLSAAVSAKDGGERERFEREAEGYRERLAGLLHLSTAARLDLFGNPLGHGAEEAGNESDLVDEEEPKRDAHDPGCRAHVAI